LSAEAFWSLELALRLPQNFSAKATLKTKKTHNSASEPSQLCPRIWRRDFLRSLSAPDCDILHRFSPEESPTPSIAFVGQVSSVNSFDDVIDLEINGAKISNFNSSALYIFDGNLNSLDLEKKHI
jgi:hypothetical protein